ncbi:MAG: endolytic transglycosylase MltG [Gammaproteobacteria bacterium]|nr:endolytic transglycosylase MltG [Gammaproteobacteria bacterium]
MLKRSFFWGFLLVLLVAVSLFYGGWRQVQAWLYEPITVAEVKQLTIEPGSNMANIATQLEAIGVTPNALALQYYSRYYGFDEQVKAGEYTFVGEVDAPSIMSKLVSGDVQSYSFTVPEGHTYAQFVEILMGHPVMKNKPEPQFSTWGQSSGYDSPEGLLFPSTYMFTRSQLPAEVVNQAWERQRSMLRKLWSDRAANLPYKSSYEALIMASIIEKETGLASERTLISGVFVRRLNKGMRLQTDPTVIYGLGDQFDGNITRKHLRQKTPYNTYVINGLPPTPIALPGEDAIHAALHPAAGKALYFVAKGDGSHAFSASLAQHQANVRKYQLQQ